MKTILAGVLVLFSLAFAQQSRIAFINPDGQLTTINPDGSDLRVLTQGEQRFQFPVWSPDGSKLATIGVDRNGGFIQVLLDAVDTQAKDIYRNAEQGVIYLYWSPDSSMVSFLANHPETNLALHLAQKPKKIAFWQVGLPFTGNGLVITRPYSSTLTLLGKTRGLGLLLSPQTLCKKIWPHQASFRLQEFRLVETILPMPKIT